MKTQKELREEYANVYNQEHKPDTLRTAKDFDYVVQLSDGSLVELSKPRIEKRFCYPDHLDDAFESVQKIRTDPEFFVSENLKGYLKLIEEYQNPYQNFWVQNLYRSASSESRLKHIVRGYRVDMDNARRLNSADVELLVSAYNMICADFEKRLRAYVKRYGLTKVYAWTYWADA